MARNSKQQHYLSDVEGWDNFPFEERAAIKELDTLFSTAKAILKHHFPETSPTLDQVIEVVEMIQQKTEKSILGCMHLER